MDGDLIQYSNDVAEYLGPEFFAQWSFPVAVSIKGAMFVRLFLDMLFSMVFLLLVLLGSLLIYSLLLSTNEEKTYEYGMLRALGMRNKSLTYVITGQVCSPSMRGTSWRRFI